MVIAINARVLNERFGGPLRYTLNIIRELARIDTENSYILFLRDEYKFDFELPDNFKKVIFRTGNRVLFDYYHIPLYSWRNRIDALLFPKNTFSPMVRGHKVPVFHDIIYFEKEIKFREFKFFDNLHHYLMIPVASRFSSLNITVSDFTASRMQELLGIKREDIRVISEGVEPYFCCTGNDGICDEVKQKFGLSAHFFLFVGSLSPRKNLQRILEAFNRIKDDVVHDLYFTASSSWRDTDSLALISRYGLGERVKKLGFLEERELVAIYNMADCYLYPSLYEGFGLPIIEAQACGCPVITSNCASCPEVAGEGALLVDPYDVDDIAEKMLMVVTDQKLREKLVDSGMKNCKKYSWDKTAEGVLNVFHEISSEQKN